MMRLLSAVFVFGGVALFGAGVCRSYEESLSLVRAYLQALQQLRHAVCYQQKHLPQALLAAAEDKPEAIRAYFTAIAGSLRAGKSIIAPTGVLKPLALPQSFLDGGLDLKGQETLLEGLREQASRMYEQMERTLAEKRRTARSLSLTLAVLSAILML